jgi:hypothetical protein
MTESDLLRTKSEICDALSIGRTLFKRWVRRGLPCELVDNRWQASRIEAEQFMVNYVSEQAQKRAVK